jgi:hypothetical protein
MDFAAPADEPGPCVVGAVYVDSNGDGLCGFGEGLEGVAVEMTAISADDEEGVYQAEAYTDCAGGFVFFCEPGAYRLRIAVDEARMLVGEDYEFTVVVGPDSVALYVRAGAPASAEASEEVE